MSSDATTDRPGVGDPAVSTLVIGLGNPILGDDGVGWKVIDELERLDSEVARAGIFELDRMSVGGLSLMERLVGYERVVVVDAVLGTDRPGTVRVLPLGVAAARPGGHLDSAHDASLVEAIAAGRALGARLPEDVTVVAIAVGRADEFDERLSPPVAAAVARAATMVAGLLAGRSEGAG